MPQRKRRAGGSDVQHLTPKISLPYKLIAKLDPDSYLVYFSALHPRKLYLWDTLIKLITLSFSLRRSVSRVNMGNVWLSSDSSQSSWVPGLPRTETI